MWITVSIGLLAFSFILLACERWTPRTPCGRLARRVLAFSPMPGARYRVTGKHLVFLGIGWKVIFALCASMFFLLRECSV